MSRPSPRKSFTVREANAMLPLVRAIVQDLTKLSEEVAERRERLSLLLGGRVVDATDPYQEELMQVEEELENDSRLLQEYVNELRQLGVEPKTAGLVDFPALLDGRKVYLCWQLGEPEVMHWHELHAGFRGRQPLSTESMEGESLSSVESGAIDS